jgi:hypothetical protein
MMTKLASPFSIRAIWRFKNEAGIAVLEDFCAEEDLRPVGIGA